MMHQKTVFLGVKAILPKINQMRARNAAIRS